MSNQYDETKVGNYFRLIGLDAKFDNRTCKIESCQGDSITVSIIDYSNSVKFLSVKEKNLYKIGLNSQHFTNLNVFQKQKKGFSFLHTFFEGNCDPSEKILDCKYLIDKTTEIRFLNSLQNYLNEHYPSNGIDFSNAM